MKQDQTAHQSLLHFTEVESILNPDRGLSIDERKECRVDSLLGVQKRSENLSEWPRILRIIRRGSLFVIEAKSLQFTAQLRFDPEQPPDGDYQIRYRDGRKLEEGRTIMVSQTDADEDDPRYSMLNAFKYHYVVVTVASARPHIKLGWRLGFNEYREVDECLD